MKSGIPIDHDAIVTRDDLEALLDPVARSVAGPRAGLFGPQSMTWRISRESAVFLGAGRAALLQLAHPWVAAALDQHSTLLSDPIARFHNTFRIVFTMIFGSTPQTLAAARSLHQLHTRITGPIPASVGRYQAGSRYEANMIPALRWVYATLIDSAVLAYENALPQLSAEEREAYYAESRTLAALFGIPASALPEHWEDLRVYIEEMCASDVLGVEDRARAMAQAVLAGAGSWIHPPRWYRALTAAWMPERLRRDFSLQYGQEEERKAAKALRRIARIYKHLPAGMRFVGPWHEAQARLTGHKPGPIASAGNRFWIGQSRLPFADSTSA